MSSKDATVFTLLTFLFLCSIGLNSEAGDLYVGSATTSITPSKPVPLSGQRYTRISREVQSPVTATALALEKRTTSPSHAQAVMVSCDLVAIRDDINLQTRVRDRVHSLGADIQKKKIFLSATHTHTGPLMSGEKYDLPDNKDFMRPKEYVSFLVDRLAGVIVSAWQSREKGGISWGLGHAVVGRNRRATYSDGSAKMYGPTDTKEFRGLEGVENHLVDTLFFWNTERELTTTAINVACPAQEVEHRYAINADYWHPVREMLRSGYRKELNVLGWIGAAGDQSPHLMYYKKAEDRMRKRRGISRLKEIARRITHAFEEAYEVAAEDIRFDVPFEHVVKTIKLPRRMVTETEYENAKSRINRIDKKEQEDPKDARVRNWMQGVVDRYRRQQKRDERPDYEVELHVLRIGDVAICTNPFELYTTYGNQIKARSHATQTVVIQLAAGSGAYLPTEKAVQGGGYSAEVMSTPVGPEGGEKLVDKTVQTINSLWSDDE